MLTGSPSLRKFRIEENFYPIVYVRGFAPTITAREATFYNTYYGYADSAVDIRAVPPEDGYSRLRVFEGQLIRLIKEYDYVDAANEGLILAIRNPVGTIKNPTRSLWICRFYDSDVINGKVRSIEEHGEELRRLICETIPAQLKQLSTSGIEVSLGENDKDYKVILIAHSMGGLICRYLLQNLLSDPMRWVHRLVTIGTPHGGVELSAIPDFLEDLVATQGNILNSAIFKEHRMREYLNLNEKNSDGELPDLMSLNGKYPEGRCLCIVGSNHEDYQEVQSLTKKVTGSYSDGLVKQDHAYIQGAYRVNVHRAHSGRKGLVNSFETYENIRRFLFGDTRIKIWMENVTLKTAKPPENVKEFYDIEFSVSVRGTGVFLHQRKQDPCENARRYEREQFPLPNVHLHTGFMDSRLRTPGAKFSRFILAFRVGQYRIQDGLLFDQYRERTIYSESLEVRVDIPASSGSAKQVVQYRWLSETADLDDEQAWKPIAPKDGMFRISFRQANTITGEVCIQAGPWPDATTEMVGIDAAHA